MTGGWAGLTGWDWFVGLVFLLSVGAGLLRGLVRSVFAIGAWLVAFLGTPLLATALIGMLAPDTGGLGFFALAFVLLFVAVRLAGAALSGSLHKVGLGGVDRGLGALLGVVRALLVVAVGAVAGAAIGWDDAPAWQEARTRWLLDELVARLEPHLPERLSGIRRV